MKIPFSINSAVYNLQLQPHETLLTVLRNHGFTEVKSGCEEGECGACLGFIGRKAGEFLPSIGDECTR